MKPRSGSTAAAPVLLTVFLGCGSNLTAPSATPEPDPAVATSTVAASDTVTLELGASATFEPAGIRVTFLRLVEDSRCPIGLTCVWEGDAEVRLGVDTKEGAEEVTLHTTLEPRSVPIGQLVLMLVDVLPRPTEDPMADPGTTRILLRLVAGDRSDGT